MLELEVTGKIIEPLRTLKWKDIPLSDLKDSEILTGSFSDLAAAMAHRGEPEIVSPDRRRRFTRPRFTGAPAAAGVRISRETGAGGAAPCSSRAPGGP